MIADGLPGRHSREYPKYSLAVGWTCRIGRDDLYISSREVSMEESRLQVSRKTVLVVLFVPSVGRDGITAINQEYWVDSALETFGQLFGGATAFPRAKGVGAMTKWVVCWSRINPSSFTATPRQQTSPIRIISIDLGVSAEEWGVRLIKAKLGS